MHQFQTILAATDATDITKILFGAVFVLIWIAGQAMAALSKRSEEQRRRRLREQIGAGTQVPTVQQRSMPRPQQHRPTPPAAPPRVQQKPPKPKRSPVKLPPPIPGSKPFATTAPIEQATTSSSAAITSPTATHRLPVTANATAVHAWLSSKTLRQQFILTEIFQPPLALRDPDSGRML